MINIDTENIGFFVANGNPNATQQIATSLIEFKRSNIAQVKEVSVKAKQLGDMFANFKLQRQGMTMRGAGGKAYQRMNEERAQWGNERQRKDSSASYETVGSYPNDGH
jgi:hypothetical protein